MERLYSAVYVGQSRNLQRRFGDHVRTNRGKVADAKQIFRRLDFWYALFDSSDLDRVEKLVIQALGPSANERYVRAKIGNPEPIGSLKED